MKFFYNETLKSIVLVLLVFLSIVLTYRLWFPDHNLFSMITVFKQEKIEKSENNLKYVYLPPKLHIHLGERSHKIIRPTHKEYLPLQQETVEIVKRILKSENHEVINISKWNNLLCSKSLLFGYEADLNTTLLAKLLNVDKCKTSIPYIKEVIVIRDDTVSDNIKCYIKNKNKLYKVKFKYKDKKLSTLLHQVQNKNFNNYFIGYMFQHKLLADDVLVFTGENILKGKKVTFLDEVDLQSNIQVKELVKKFFEKFNIVKHIDYKNKSQTKIIQKEFIDRRKILKIYNNGKIKYTSAELPNKNQTNMYVALKNAIEFVESNLGFPKKSYISKIKRISDSHYIFCFDYFVEDYKVKFKGKDIPDHAIKVEVKGNVVSEYERYVKRSKIGKKKILNVANIKAINQAILKYSQNTDKKNIKKLIKDIQLVYVDNGNKKESYPCWFIKINKQEFFVNSVAKEN